MPDETTRHVPTVSVRQDALRRYIKFASGDEDYVSWEDSEHLRVAAFDAAPPATGEYVALSVVENIVTDVHDGALGLNEAYDDLRAGVTPRPDPDGTVSVGRETEQCEWCGCKRVFPPSASELLDAAMLRMVGGALRSAIDAHGPIDKDHVPSAAKRVVSLLVKGDWPA